MSPALGSLVRRRVATALGLGDSDDGVDVGVDDARGVHADRSATRMSRFTLRKANTSSAESVQADLQRERNKNGAAEERGGKLDPPG